MRLFISRLILWGIYSLLIPHISSHPISDEPSLAPQNSSFDRSPLLERHTLKKRAYPQVPCYNEGFQNPRHVSSERARFQYIMTRNGQPSASLLLVKQKNYGTDGQVWEAKLAYYNTQDNANLQLPIGRDLDVGVKLSRGGTAIDQTKLQERVITPWVMQFREQFYSTNTDQSVQAMELGAYDMFDGMTQGLIRGNLRMVTLETMGAMGEVLKEAHRVDVINRDVKPENILFMKNGFRYMIDWDHARYVPKYWDGTRWVEKGVCDDFSGGTTSYKGPEWKNREPYDGPKNDVFAWTMVWLWADQRRQMTNMLQDSIARMLHAPRSGTVAPGLTYQATKELLGRRFQGMMRPEKVELMARGLCKQDERYTMSQMLYWFNSIPHY